VLVPEILIIVKSWQMPRARNGTIRKRLSPASPTMQDAFAQTTVTGLIRDAQQIP
jgi:hypothetical protein